MNKKVENFNLQVERGANIFQGNLNFSYDFDFLGKKFEGDDFISILTLFEIESFNEEGGERYITLTDKMLDILKRLNDILDKESKKFTKVFQGFRISKVFKPWENYKLEVILDSQLFEFQFKENQPSGLEEMNKLVIEFSKELYNYTQKEIS